MEFLVETNSIARKLLSASFNAQVHWNSACLLSVGADKYCNGPGLGQSRARSPGSEYAGTRFVHCLTLRDDNNEQ